MLVALEVVTVEAIDKLLKSLLVILKRIYCNRNEYLLAFL